MIQLSYSYFDTANGSGLSMEQRVLSALELMEGGRVPIQFEDGTICHNEQELRTILKARGLC